MIVTEYIGHYLTAKDLGLTIRDSLIDGVVGAYDDDQQFIAGSGEQVFLVDFNNPCCLIVEVPSGAQFSIKIEQIKTKIAAKIAAELCVPQPAHEYGPRNV